MRSRFWRGWRGKEAARFCSAECETPRKHPPPPPGHVHVGLEPRELGVQAVLGWD